jgi:hypothetical protein
MKNIVLSAAATMVLLAGTIPQQARAQWQVPDPAGNVDHDCDRACLQGFIDQYPQALLAHDPYRLPVTKDVKFTENTVRLRVGDGLWNTLSGVGAEFPRLKTTRFPGLGTS